LQTKLKINFLNFMAAKKKAKKVVKKAKKVAKKRA
jgi:hypothetical protein